MGGRSQKSQVGQDEDLIEMLAENYMRDQKRLFETMGDKPLGTVALTEVEQLARGLEIYGDTPESEQWWGQHIDAVLQGQRPTIPIAELHRYAKWLKKRIDLNAD